MNEEIDIIELLKRVKEGKAPKKIEIDGTIFMSKNLKKFPIDCLYYTEDNDGHIVNWFEKVVILCDTKIKILDKPIIEELEISIDGKSPILIKKDGKTNNLRTIDVEIINKTNEIIKWINEKN